MSDAPSTAEPASRPERDAADVPPGIGRLLHVLQWLILYGQTAAATLHQRSAKDFNRFAERYRRTDFTEILNRIRRGLLLAAALQEKLRAKAATGRDVAPVERRWATSRPNHTSPAEKRSRVRHTNIVDMPADKLPTPQQIAAELQRRPLGAVLADICRDLGLRPGDVTREQWQELHELILHYGGFTSTVLFTEGNLRLKPLLEAALAGVEPPAAETPAPRDATACPTGPPPLALAA